MEKLQELYLAQLKLTEEFQKLQRSENNLNKAMLIVWLFITIIGFTTMFYFL